MPLSSPPTFKGGFSNLGLGTAGQVLTSNGAGIAPSFQAGGGGGIPNATVYWVVSPNPFIIHFGDGKITGSMFSRLQTGQYVLDMTSLLTTGIYALFQGSMNVNVAPGVETSIGFSNAAFTGQWIVGSKNVGIAMYQWSNPWAAFDPPTFSLLILAQ